MTKRFSAGLLAGLLIGLLLSAATLAFAAQPIKLIVNGVDITPKCDVPPQIIDGRTMVPARFLAEALGATVKWDSENRAVIITKNTQPDVVPANLSETKDLKSIPVLALGETADINGIKITVFDIYHVDASPYGGVPKEGFVIDLAIENTSTETLKKIGSFKFEFDIDNELYRDEVNEAFAYFDKIKTRFIYPGEKTKGIYKLVTDKNIKITKIIYVSDSGIPIASWKVNDK